MNMMEIIETINKKELNKNRGAISNDEVNTFLEREYSF
jgi:hypothetical protein